MRNIFLAIVFCLASTYVWCDEEVTQSQQVEIIEFKEKLALQKIADGAIYATGALAAKAICDESGVFYSILESKLFKDLAAVTACSAVGALCWISAEKIAERYFGIDLDRNKALSLMFGLMTLYALKEVSAK